MQIVFEDPMEIVIGIGMYVCTVELHIRQIDAMAKIKLSMH